MQPRAFVVMPFGKKAPGLDFGRHGKNAGHSKKRKSGKSGQPTIDFDRIYLSLFKPALEKAGYEVARADSESNAGDIRTDMFFELVTADLVVADISIWNPNVYYELGVRHGVCPRGVFIVSASAAPPAPFDVAPDRRFTYEAAPFLSKTRRSRTRNRHRGANRPDLTGVAGARAEVERLAKRFRDATTLDHQSVGSPVYAHLPGLQPVNWDQIETSRAKYFNALRSDWMDCVKWAQANGRPGDILTLARNAPTRLHEARILFETAVALIDLCRYGAAESILADVVRLNPEHTEAQLSLALVTAHLGWIPSAEHRLRKILEQHNADPSADDLLAQVFRQLWRLSWPAAQRLPRDRSPRAARAELARRREKAREASQLAVSAIHSFARAHRTDPKEYFAGFNALVLAFVLQEIGVPRSEIDAGWRDAAAGDPHALTALVRYTATSEQQLAIEAGDYVKQFWCTTTLAGLLLIERQGKAALQKILEACAIPAATSYQLQTLRDRLGLLVDLGVGTTHVERALNVVEKTLQAKIGHCACERVILWHGYGIGPGRKHSGLPERQVRRLSREIARALAKWSVTDTDLAICGGMNESDVLFAEACLDRNVRVRVMLREPVASESARTPQWPPLASPAWRERMHALRTQDGEHEDKQQQKKEVWIDTDHLGPVPAGQEDPVAASKRRHKEWLINTAKMEASPTFKAGESLAAVKKTSLRGLFLSDKGVADDGADFVREVERFDGYQGEVKIISLGTPAMRRTQRARSPKNAGANRAKTTSHRTRKKAPSKKTTVHLKKDAASLKPVVHVLRKPLRVPLAAGE